MNIKCFGYRGITSQVNRIEEGFEQLGFNTDHEQLPDLIYANDISSWDEALKASQNWPCEVILNFLDLPVHLPVDAERQVQKVRRMASEGYKITCISEFVQGQLNKFCDIYSPIIYQPAKNITNLNLDRDIEFLIVGRNNDLGKGHKDITFPVIEAIDGNLKRLHVIGENVGFGEYHGFVSDQKLNELYNRAKYVFIPSIHDGLGMQLIESVIAGATPISYRWHPTAKEFIEKELVFDSINDIISFIKDGNVHNSKLYKDYSVKFSGKTIAKNILNVAEITN